MAIAKVGSCEPSVKTDAGKWGKTGKMKKARHDQGDRTGLGWGWDSYAFLSRNNKVRRVAWPQVLR